MLTNWLKRTMILELEKFGESAKPYALVRVKPQRVTTIVAQYGTV